jgi:hypothetical protein
MNTKITISKADYLIVGVSYFDRIELGDLQKILEGRDLTLLGYRISNTKVLDSQWKTEWLNYNPIKLPKQLRADPEYIRLSKEVADLFKTKTVWSECKKAGQLIIVSSNDHVDISSVIDSFESLVNLDFCSIGSIVSIGYEEFTLKEEKKSFMYVDLDAESG